METQKIEVKFFNRVETATYTTDVMKLLITDSNVEYIADHETGEILYDNTGFMEKMDSLLRV